MGMLEGKRILIFGVASKRSIAWGIAAAMHREGASLAFTYQNERLKDRVVDMAAELGSTLTFACDVADDAEINTLMAELGKEWSDGFDGLVHAVAFAPREALDGDFLESIDRDAFRIAHDISSYSFAAVAKAARKQLRPGSSLITLSYLGAVRAMPEARNAAVSPTCSMVVFSRIGATADTCPSSFLKLPIPAAAKVLMGPAEIALTRICSGPSDVAMKRVLASSEAFASPMTL